MKKYIQKINNNREISLFITDETIEIQEYIINNNIYEDYRLIYSDDYYFSAYTEHHEQDQLVFNIDINHPLYYPFLHFLNNEIEIKFGSDFKKEEYDNICYVKISKQDKLITLSFVNHIKEEHNSFEKFNYEIKNIMFDLRSKLDEQGTDIKQRLSNFFNEAITILTEEYHQITMEEYMDKLVKKLTKE